MADVFPWLGNLKASPVVEPPPPPGSPPHLTRAACTSQQTPLCPSILPSRCRSVTSGTLHCPRHTRLGALSVFDVDVACRRVLMAAQGWGEV